MRPRIFRRAERGGRSPTRGRGRDCHGGGAALGAARRRSRGDGGPRSRPRLRGRLPLDRRDSGCGRTTENRKIVRAGASDGHRRASSSGPGSISSSRPATSGALSCPHARMIVTPKGGDAQAAPGEAKSLLADRATRQKGHLRLMRRKRSQRSNRPQCYWRVSRPQQLRDDVDGPIRTDPRPTSVCGSFVPLFCHSTSQNAATCTNAR